MSRLETLRRALELVDLVSENIVNLKSALNLWPKHYPEDRNLLEGTEWQLMYINNDTDIRIKEPEYEKKQLEYLCLLRERIRHRIKLVEEK
jgi:hypothetical protein